MSDHETVPGRDLSHLTRIDVVDVAASVAADKLTPDEVFKRTYLGRTSTSSTMRSATSSRARAR